MANTPEQIARAHAELTHAVQRGDSRLRGFRIVQWGPDRGRLLVTVASSNHVGALQRVLDDEFAGGRLGVYEVTFAESVPVEHRID